MSETSEEESISHDGPEKVLNEVSARQEYDEECLKQDSASPADVEKRLAIYEEMFKDRYTEPDCYPETAPKIGPPPIVDNWFGRRGRGRYWRGGGRGGARGNNGGGQYGGGRGNYRQHDRRPYDRPENNYNRHNRDWHNNGGQRNNWSQESHGNSYNSSYNRR